MYKFTSNLTLLAILVTLATSAGAVPSAVSNLLYAIRLPAGIYKVVYGADSTNREPSLELTLGREPNSDLGLTIGLVNGKVLISNAYTGNGDNAFIKMGGQTTVWGKKRSFPFKIQRNPALPPTIKSASNMIFEFEILCIVDSTIGLSIDSVQKLQVIYRLDQVMGNWYETQIWPRVRGRPVPGMIPRPIAATRGPVKDTRNTNTNARYRDDGITPVGKRQRISFNSDRST